MRVEAVTRQTLSAASALLSAPVRQVARLTLSRAEASVRFEGTDGDPLFARLADENNAIRVTTADGCLFTAGGRGAGRIPTVESVWADLTDVLSEIDIAPQRKGGR